MRLLDRISSTIIRRAPFHEIIDRVPLIKSEIAILVDVCRADGGLQKEEYEFIYAHYKRHYREDVLNVILEYFNWLVKKEAVSLRDDIVKARANGYEYCIFLCMLIYSIVVSGRKISINTLGRTREMAEKLGITGADLNTIEHIFGIKTDPDDMKIRTIRYLLVSNSSDQRDIIINNINVNFYLAAAGGSYLIVNSGSLDPLYLNGIPMGSRSVEFFGAKDRIQVKGVSIDHEDVRRFFNRRIVPEVKRHYFREDGGRIVRLREEAENAAFMLTEDNDRLTLHKLKRFSFLRINGTDYEKMTRRIYGDIEMHEPEVEVSELDQVELDGAGPVQLKHLMREDRLYREMIYAEDRKYIITNRPYAKKNEIRLVTNTPHRIELAIEKTGDAQRLKIVRCKPPLYVNSRLITADTDIKDGDRIIVLGNTIVCNFQRHELLHFVAKYHRFDVRGLSFKFPKSDAGVDDVSFTAENGELMAIMGASGSGKSTLMSLLTGYNPPADGEAYLDDIDYFRYFHQLKESIGFVPQDDILLPNLTVQENMIFNARIRMPGANPADLDRKKESILAEVGLSDQKRLRVGDTLENILSGGQRKRLSIAVELMTDPDVLYLDEPTSGLSSEDAYKVVKVLREVARAGKIVIVVIHQPSSKIFNLFDKLLVLDTGGKAIFSGRPAEGLRFFRQHAGIGDEPECPSCGSSNPDEMFDIIEEKVLDRDGTPIMQKNPSGGFSHIRKYSPDYWRNYYRMHRQMNGKKDAEEAAHAPTRAAAAQPKRMKPDEPIREKLVSLYYLFMRNLLTTFRDRNNMAITALISPLLGLFIGLILRTTREAGVLETALAAQYHYGDNPNIKTFMFLFIIVCLFMGLTASIAEVVKDRPLLKREKILNIDQTAYYASKFLPLLLFSAIQVTILYFIASLLLEIRGMAFHYLFYGILTSVSGITLGLLIGCFLRSQGAAFNIVPLVLIPQIILGGALLQYEDMNRKLFLHPDSVLPEIAFLIPSHYAYEGLMVANEEYNPYLAQMERFDAERRALVARLDAGQISDNMFAALKAKLTGEKDAWLATMDAKDHVNDDVQNAVQMATSRTENEKVNHFLSLRKNIGSGTYSTYWLDALVILMMSAVAAAGAVLALKYYDPANR